MTEKLSERRKLSRSFESAERACLGADKISETDKIVQFGLIRLKILSRMIAGVLADFNVKPSLSHDNAEFNKKPTTNPLWLSNNSNALQK